VHHNPLYLGAWLTMEGGRMAWLWAPGWYRGLSLVWDATVVDTFAQGHYKDSARQVGFADTKAEAAKSQKYHDLQSNYHLQPVAIETTGVYGKSTAHFLSGLAKSLATPGSASGSTRVCPYLWSGEMLPAYWLVCEFDLTKLYVFFF